MRFFNHPWFKMFRKICCILLLVGAVSVVTGCGEEYEEDNNEMEESFRGQKGASSALVEEKTMGKRCWVCPLFESAFQAADALKNEVIPTAARGAIPLLGICFGLWLAIRVMKLVASMAEPDVAGFWNDVGLQAFWATLTAILLRKYTWVVELMEAIYLGFVDLAMEVIGSIHYDGGAVSCPSATSAGLQGSLVCLMTALQEKINFGQDIAMATMVYGPLKTMPSAFFLYAVSLCMAAYFPILLLDTIFRYGMVMCFLPLGIVSLGFKQVRSYSGKIVDFVVGIGFQVVGVCVFTALCCGIIKQTLAVSSVPSLGAALSPTDEIARWFDNSPNFMGLVFVSFFCILFAGVVCELFDNFGTGLAHGNTATQTVMAMRNTAKTAGKIASFGKNRISRKMDEKAKKALEQDSKEVRNARKAVDKAQTPEEKKKAQDNLKKAEDRQNSRRDLARSRLADKGYLREDKDGNLQQTQAYDKLGKGSISQGLRDFRADWNSSGAQQTDDRWDEKANKVTE